MLYFFDESGSFDPSDNSENLWLVASAVVPETTCAEIEQAFKNFLTAIPHTERTAKGEPKGSLLSERSRSYFVEFVNAFPQILIVPTVVDLGASSDQRQVTDGARLFGQMMLDKAPCYNQAEMREIVTMAGRQVRNLAPDRFTRLYALTLGIHHATRLSIIRYKSPQYAQCFASPRFMLDEVSPREKCVFEKLLTLWIPVLSQLDPVILVQGVRKQGHPLFDQYCDAGGLLNATTMICRNLNFADSRHSWGIQIADIAASILRRAVADREDEKRTHWLAVDLLAHSLLEPDNPLGMVAFGNQVCIRRDSRFAKLVRAVREKSKATLQ